MNDVNSPQKELEQYEKPDIEIVEIAPEEATLAVCKTGANLGALSICVACSMNGS